MKITFMPQNIVIEGNPNKSLLQMAQENQIKIKSICNGKPSCAECRVKITEGSSNVPPPGKEELNLIGTSYFIDNRRLSCQVRCFGSITVDLTEQLSKVDTQKKIKGVKAKDQKDMHAKQDTMILSGVDNPQTASEPKQQQHQGPKPEHRNENKSQNQNRPDNRNENRAQSQNRPDNRNNQNHQNNNNRQDHRPPKKPDNRPDIRAQNQNNMNNQKPADSNAKPGDHKDSKE